MKTRLLGLAVLALTALSGRAGAALIVTVTESHATVGGLFNYSYEVMNDSDEEYLIFNFVLDVPTSSNLINLITPSGWEVFYSAGEPRIEWLASEELNAIQPGASEVFGFSSHLGPGPIRLTALAITPDGNGVAEHTGRTTGPFLVPEPSGIALLSAGVVTLLCGMRIRRAPRFPACDNIG